MLVESLHPERIRLVYVRQRHCLQTLIQGYRSTAVAEGVCLRVDFPTHSQTVLTPGCLQHFLRPIDVVSNGSAAKRCIFRRSPCERISISLLRWTTSDESVSLEFALRCAPAVWGLRTKSPEGVAEELPSEGHGSTPPLRWSKGRRDADIASPGRRPQHVAGLGMPTRDVQDRLDCALSSRTRISSSSSRLTRSGFNTALG